MKMSRTGAWIKILCGIVSAVAATELLLIPFSTALENRWQAIAKDDPTSPQVREVRSYREGIAVSHFSLSRARLTGNPWLAGAPVLVVVGNSYVEGLHVNDQNTLGSLIESEYRAAGVPLNVRQYGWNGGNPATYVSVAADINARWNHPPVIAVVSSGDLGDKVWHDLDHFEETSSGIQARHYDSLPGERPGGLRDWMLRHSRLAYQIAIVAKEILQPPASVTSPGATRQLPRQSTVDVEVEELKRAYGDQLLILYVPDIFPKGKEMEVQDILLHSCSKFQVRCLSEIKPLENAETRLQVPVKGFANTLPGVGHLNAVGYQALADDLRRNATLPSLLSAHAQLAAVSTSNTQYKR